ncbi:hypothetical protein ACE6H2_023404 [Prunus campanulata]
MHSPSVSHRNAVDRILRYLKLAPGKGLMFSKNRDLEVVGYTDADWAGKLAIDIAHNPVQHDRTKHVEVNRHFIKEKIEKKIIRLPFVKSEDQLADILTKAVCSRVFYDSLTKLGIGDVYAPI